MKLPARIAKYELFEFLGGGMSEVYKARDTVLGRTVAVKLLTSQGAQNEDMRSRFLLEAKVSSGIAHENVITTHDYGEEEGIPFMVMEFLTGRTLKEVLRSGDEVSLRRRVSLGLQLAKALAHVHSLALIHRDVKPDNIHIDANGRLKLMDFGIVKTGEINLTQAGYALGTPHYVAPELVIGKPPTTLIDVYSFGVVFFEMLTNKRAIQADSVEAIFYKILHEEIPYQDLEEAAIPEALRQIVRDSTTRAPEKRTQSMAEVATQIEAWLEDNPTQEKAVPPSEPVPPGPTRVRIPTLWLGAATAIAVVLAGSVFFVLRSATTEVRGNQVILEDSFGEMVLIPAGVFLYGPTKTAVELPAYFIDRHEVSNEDYETFCDSTGRPLPPGFQRGQPGLPVTNVTLDDANAFAKWAGKRLPTDKEWQKAARGVDGRHFPWGNDPDAKHANVSDNPDDSWQHVVSTDAYRLGRSPFGVLQMIGNVREWTSEVTAPSVSGLRLKATSVDPPATTDELWILVKGGSYQYKLAETALFMEEAVPARFRAPDLGFRCVKDKR